LLNWIRNWGDESQFNQYGVGSYIHNNKTIVSWSLSDCSYQKSIAIGIHTDEEFRHKGFAQLVVSETIKGCFEKGYETVEWLCVDSNKGSIAIAEKQIEMDYSRINGFVEMLKEIGLCSSFEESLQNSISAL
jgi:RimJ/RimL family protein N-acetyltransferase